MAVLSFRNVLFSALTRLLLEMFICSISRTGAIDPTVHVTSPVNLIRTGGMLSVRCQVWNIDDSYEVTLSRQLHGDTKSRRISWNNDVLSSVEDRVFLAIRQIKDASVVYFLTIIDVTVEDRGEYSCKVISTSDTLREVAVDSVDIDMLFFPSESFPQCHHDYNMLTVYAGTKLSFNCSSVAGNPVVTLKWSRTGSGSIPVPETEQVTTNYGITYSIINLNPMVDDSGTIFICHATSKAFPKINKSCNIGPITVLPSTSTLTPSKPDGLQPRGTVMVSPDHRPPVTPRSKDTKLYPKHGESIGINCKQSCSMLNSPVLYWFLATTIAALSAFIFLLIGIALMVKLCRLPTRTMRPIYGCATEDIYVDLDERMLDANRVYMTLEKPSKTVVIEPDGTYTRTPVIVPKIR